MSFLKKKKNYFALAFSDQEIQLAQADKKGRIILASTLKLEPGIITRGRVKDPQKLTSLLGKFLNSQKIKTKFVSVGLAEITSFSRVLTLPKLPLEELDDAVKWQSEPLLPMPLAKAYLDWMILEEAPTSTQILVMALPTQVVEEYAQILENLGYQLVAFEPTSLSLIRLLKKGEKTCLAVEIKEKEAVLVICGPQGEIELSSTVLFKESDSQDLFTTIKEALSFYQKKVGPEKGVAQIYLCGSGATQTVAQKIQKETGLKTELLPCQPANFATTVSLAQKDIAAPRDEKTINLIPPRIQGVYDLAEKSHLLNNWLKFWLFSLFLLAFSFSVAAARVYFDLKKVEGEIIFFQAGITPEMKAIETQGRDLARKATQIVALADSQTDLVDLLDVLQAATPENLYLNHYSINFETKELILNGLAQNRDQLLTFKQNLEKSGRFTQVRVPLSSLEKEENVTFTVSLSGR